MDTKDYGKREDGTPKGKGYFGEIPRADDPTRFSTELSATGDLTDKQGKLVLYPLIHGDSTREEIDHLLSGKPLTSVMYERAEIHAAKRLQAGKSPFAEEGEQKPLPTSYKDSFHAGFHEQAQK